MNAMNRMHVAAGGLSLALFGSIAGCENPPSEAGAPPPERTASAKQAVGASSLPVREFVQLPDLCPGSVNDTDTFSSGAALFVTAATGGKVSLGVREPNGTTTTLGGPDWYVTTPTAIDVPGYRVACTTEATLIDRGPGPVGRVYSFDKTQGTKIVCWSNPTGSATWTKKIVAQAAAGEPADAFWPVVYASAKSGGAPVADAFEVVYVRDAEYAPWMKIAAGRAAREGAFFSRVHILTGQVQIFDQDTYPDWRAEANAFVGPVDCSGRCGWTTNGVVWSQCAGCPSGQVCNGGVCAADACTPLTFAQACAAKNGAQACGSRSDGCGGKIDCNACPAGQACGATGDPEFCGSRPAPVTAQKLIELYEDKHQRLCGTLPDPVTGADVQIDSTCTQCVNNICMDTPLPACIPTGGLASFTP